MIKPIAIIAYAAVFWWVSCLLLRKDKHKHIAFRSEVILKRVRCLFKGRHVKSLSWSEEDAHFVYRYCRCLKCNKKILLWKKKS
ncbi:hypothetical protein DXK51_01840 [Bacillus cereus]|nr:hypothetical protein [Bacillus cereus]